MAAEKKSKKNRTSSGALKNGLYKRGDNWYARLMVDGKLRRFVVGPDKNKAQAIIAEIKSRRALSKATGEMSGINDMFKRRERKKFEEAVSDYMNERPHLKFSTRRSYEEIFKNYLLPAFCDFYVEDISEAMIAQFQAALSIKKSSTRVNNIMGPLRYVLKTCLRRKFLSDNPTINISPLRQETTEINPVPSEDLEKVLKAMPSYQRPLFITLAWTGARPDELFALRWSDINFVENTIRISKGRVRGRKSTTKTKAGNRTVPLLSIVKETLSSLKKTKCPLPESHVFLNKHNQPHNKHVDREWRLASKKAGVEHRPAYFLRHTFASFCLENGMPATWVAKVLGHSTPQITFKHYARFIDDSTHQHEQRLEQRIAMRRQTTAPPDVRRESQF